MKRMHIGLRVRDLDESIAFYSKLFGQPPSLHRSGYAKWMLDDPRVNFSIDTHGDETIGSAHYGIQAEDAAELAELRDRIDTASLTRQDQDDLVCGYQRQNKSWVVDPQGLQWEAFHTLGIVDEGYGCTEMPGDDEV